MSNDVKSRMKGFITEARNLKKEAKGVEDQARQVKDRLKELEERVIIGQTQQRSIDLEYDKVQNEYYAAVAKKELLQQKCVAAEGNLQNQKIKIASFGTEAEECNKKAQEAEEKYNKQVERMAELRRGLKDAHALSVLADKEVSLKQMEIKAAEVEQHESSQRLSEAEHELARMLGDIEKYDKIAEIWESKCEVLEVELLETKANAKLMKGKNSDSLEVTEELREESMFLQMDLRRYESRAEYAEGIVDKLEQQCERLNDQLFLENGKFMEMSQKLENKAELKASVKPAQTAQQERLLAPSKMELPMSPAAPITPEIIQEVQEPLEEQLSVTEVPVVSEQQAISEFVSEVQDEVQVQEECLPVEEFSQIQAQQVAASPLCTPVQQIDEQDYFPEETSAFQETEDEQQFRTSDMEQVTQMLVEGDTSEAVE